MALSIRLFYSRTIAFTPSVSADFASILSAVAIVNPSVDAIARCRASSVLNAVLKRPIQSLASL